MMLFIKVGRLTQVDKSARSAGAAILVGKKDEDERSISLSQGSRLPFTALSKDWCPRVLFLGLRLTLCSAAAQTTRAVKGITFHYTTLGPELGP